LVEVKRTDPDLFDNFHLTIAGGTVRSCDKYYLSSLQRFVREHALEGQVSFSGYLQTEAIPDFIRSLDLMVLPYREAGSGSASGPLMWARALGVPVLASEARNFAELITPGKDGLLCRTESGCFGIAEQLRVFFSNSDLRESLKVGALEARNENSWENTAYRLEMLFEKVCTNVAH
jgi:glycosyltransferase involved in cell wall biosynthesis